MTTYRPSWNLTTIPDALLTAERNRRISAARKEPPRPRIELPCISCGKPLSARERRKPCRFCGTRNPRKVSA